MKQYKTGTTANGVHYEIRFPRAELQYHARKLLEYLIAAIKEEEKNENRNES